jgi:hypothetical protein
MTLLSLDGSARVNAGDLVISDNGESTIILGRMEFEPWADRDAARSERARRYVGTA